MLHTENGILESLTRENEQEHILQKGNGKTQVCVCIFLIVYVKGGDMLALPECHGKLRNLI